MKIQHCVLVMLFIVEYVSSQRWCTWVLQSVNQSNHWTQYGLRLTTEKCLWMRDQSKPQINLRLYNELFRDYVSMQLYLDDSFIEEYFYYNRTAIITFPQCQQNTFQNDAQMCIIQPHVHLYNNKLTVTLKSGEILAIQLSQNYIQNQIFSSLKIMLYFLINISLVVILLWKRDKRRHSVQLIIANVGWIGFLMTQFMTTLLYYRPSFPNKSINILLSLFIELPFGISIVLWKKQIQIPKFQMRFIVIFVCENICQLILSRDINFILFTLILSIQIAHNIINKQKYSIPSVFLWVYGINQALIFYILGFSFRNCNKKVNYLICGIIIILAGLQTIFLIMQQRFGPYLCFKKLIIDSNEEGVKDLAEQIELKNKDNHLNPSQNIQQDEIVIDKKETKSMIAAGIIANK